MKKKDNLTDIVEELPKIPVNQNKPAPAGQKPEIQQVVDFEGNIINLRQRNRKKIAEELANRVAQIMNNEPKNTDFEEAADTKK